MNCSPDATTTSELLDNQDDGMATGKSFQSMDHAGNDAAPVSPSFAPIFCQASMRDTR